jgi:hypothetical protein
MKRSPLVVLILLALFASPAVVQAARNCSSCAKSIKGRYITSGIKAYCSQTCFVTTLDECNHCGIKLKGRYIISEKKKFCSNACLESILPQCEVCEKPLIRRLTIKGHVFCDLHAKSPRCTACQLPFLRGGELPDLRHVCETCNKIVIYDMVEAMKLFRIARQELYRITARKSRQIPKLKLVGRDQLNKRTNLRVDQQDGLQLNGFYHRTETTRTSRNGFGKTTTAKKVEKTIYILYALSPDTFLTTAVHEFTHDMIAEFFPHLDGLPLWAEEGICQYVAVLLCRKRDFADQLESIQTSPDRIYGDGYRYFEKKVGPNNWSGLLQWIKRTDPKKLPATAPK